MNFFLLSIIAILFCKEYIIVNDELIIYTTFISITIIAIKMFGFLEKTFADIKIAEQYSLKTSSNMMKEELVNLDLNANLNFCIPYYYAVDLKNPSDFSEPDFDSI